MMIHIQGNYDENMGDCLLIYEEIMIDIRGNYNKYMFLILKPNQQQPIQIQTMLLQF